MKKQFKLGFIGCGDATMSLIRGAVLSDFLREKKIIVGDQSEEELDKLDYLGVRTTTDIKLVAENSEFLVFAFKPEKLSEVVSELGGYLPEKVISFLTGVTKSAIKNALGVGPIRVARCVLNMPTSIGSGAVGVEYSDFVKSMDDTDFISNILNTVGTVVDVTESKIDAVTALGNGGCACVFMFIDAMVSAGVKLGLTKDEARLVAIQTAFGCSELASRDDNTLEELVMQSCKGSAALEVVKVFEDKNLSSIVSEALTACLSRIAR